MLGIADGLVCRGEIYIKLYIFPIHWNFTSFILLVLNSNWLNIYIDRNIITHHVRGNFKFMKSLFEKTGGETKTNAKVKANWLWKTMQVTVT